MKTITLTDTQHGFLYGMLESVIAISKVRGMKDHIAMTWAKEILEMLK
jgi:hypothetical protein